MTQKARLNLYDFLNNEQDYAPVTSPNLNRTRSPHLKTYSTEEDDDEIGPWFDVLPPKLSVTTPKTVANSLANKQTIPLQTPKGDPKPSKLTTVRNYSSAAEKAQHKSPKIIPKPIVENKPDRSGIFTNELLKERISPSLRKVSNVKKINPADSQPRNDKLILIVANPESGTTKIMRTEQKPQVTESPKPRHSFKRSSIMVEKSLDLKGTINMRDSGEFEVSKSMTKIHSQTARVRGESTDRKHSRRPSPADLGDVHEKPEMNPSFVIEGIQTKTSASKQQGFKLLKANIIARNRTINNPKTPVPVMPVIPTIPTEEKTTIDKETIYSEGRRMIVTDRTGRPPLATNKTPLRKEILYSKEKEDEKEDIKTKLRVLRRINRPSYLQQQTTVSPNETKDMSGVSLNRQKSVPRISHHHHEQQPIRAEPFQRHSEADALRPENNSYMLPLLKMQAMVKCPAPKPHLTMLNKNYDETVTVTGTGTTNEVTKYSSYQSNEKTGNTTNGPYVIGDSEKYILNTDTCESNTGYDASDQLLRTSPSPKNNSTPTPVVFKFRKFTPTRMIDKAYKEALLGPDFYSKSYYNQSGQKVTEGNEKQPLTPGKNPLYSLTQKYKISKEQRQMEGNLTNNKNTRNYRRPPTFEIQAAIIQEKTIIRNARILKN